MDNTALNFSVKYGAERDIPSQDAIGNGLNNFNAAFNTKNEAEAVNIYAKDATGNVVGGLIGTIWLQWLYVQNLWIHESYRANRVGTKLMKMAETEALGKDCKGIFLDTMSFQAKGFYEKCGYTQFGQLDDFGEGHTRYFFQKKISGN